MKVALCCIGRLENRYAVEFVEYYKSIGFDKIFIYDNNFGDEEHFEDVLQSYIDDGFVEVIDFRDKLVAQLGAYTDCYNTHKDEYDWIAFFDFDEYLTFVGDEDVKGFLSDKAFDDYQCIHINWMVYGDNGHITYEDKPLLERFTKPMDYDNGVGYSFPENNHVKSIVRGGIDNFKWQSNPHTPSCNLKCCDALGKQCNDSPFKPYDFDRCYIKHFYTKSAEQFFTLKERRQRPDRSQAEFINFNDCINRFFSVNEKTDEKVKFIQNYINTINSKDLSIFICTHKDFEQVVTNPCYKVIDNRYLKTKDINGLTDKFYSEILSYYNVAEYENLPKYVGFCHYRRYFNFLDNIPNLNEVFKENGAIVVTPMNFNEGTYKQYAFFHNIEDLNITINIIRGKYPEYVEPMNAFLSGKIFFPYNMFIMKKEDFLEYIGFMRGVLDEYVNIVGTDIEKRIKENESKYFKNIEKCPQNSTMEYQYRIGSFLAERLTNIFLFKKFKKVMAIKAEITENKYITDKYI